MELPKSLSFVLFYLLGVAYRARTTSSSSCVEPFCRKVGIPSKLDARCIDVLFPLIGNCLPDNLDMQKIPLIFFPLTVGLMNKGKPASLSTNRQITVNGIPNWPCCEASPASKLFVWRLDQLILQVMKIIGPIVEDVDLD